LFPILFEYHWLVIHTYGFLLALGIILGLYVSANAARKEGIDASRVYDLGLYLALSALAGAKLLLIVTDLDYYIKNPSQIISLETLRAGGVFYGGFLAAVAVGLIYMRHHRLPMWKMTDIFSPGIALGQAIGRMGCFSAGCCYGKPSSSPFAVTFTNPISQETVGVPLMIPLHPTQLYEAVCNFLLFMLLWWSLSRKRFDGQIFVLYLTVYSGLRFVIEFFRGDADRGFLFGGSLSTSQFISLVLLVLAAVLFFRLGRPAKSSNLAVRP
jgi:phosphatidylglycerol---prolipoprotein diacylglyceryl transferase